MSKKQNEKLQFFYDDEAATTISNQITDSYTSGYVNEEFGEKKEEGTQNANQY